MTELRQAALGVLGAVLSVAILLGSLSLAIVENGLPVAALPPSLTFEPPASPAASPLPGTTAITSPMPTATFPPPTSCPPPAGWFPVVVMLDETLDDIALKYDVSTDLLRQGNCLSSANSLMAGSILYVPPPATPTLTAPQIASPTTTFTATFLPPPTNPPVVCIPSPPFRWVQYRVQSGDTLYSLSRTFGTTVTMLMQVNCLTSSRIRTGQLLWVPNVPTATPTFTPILLPSPTPLPSATPTLPPSLTPTLTSAPVLPSPTSTPTTIPATPTQTQTPTSTGTATQTPTPTQENTVTLTPTPTNTATPTPTLENNIPTTPEAIVKLLPTGIDPD